MDSGSPTSSSSPEMDRLRAAALAAFKAKSYAEVRAGCHAFPSTEPR